MIEIIEKVKEIIKEKGKDALINDYKIDYGIYVKVTENSIEEEDLFYVTNKLDINTVIETYNWFRPRAFYEGMLNKSGNKILLQSGALSKKIHSVTPYSIMFKYINIDKFKNPECIEPHFEIISSLTEGGIEVKKISKFFFEKIIEIKQLLEQAKTPPKPTDRILLFSDKPIDCFEKGFINYMKRKGFGDKYKTIDIDGELYGLPCLGMALDDKKIIFNMSNTRDVPFRVSFSDNIILSYIGKLGNKIDEIVNKDTEIKYKISLALPDIENIDKHFDIAKKQEFHKLTPVGKNTANSIKSMKSHEEVLKLIENYITKWTLSPAINRYIHSGNDVSDYMKSALLKIDNQNILQQIIIDRDYFKSYFIKDSDIDISKSLEHIFKLIYEFVCNLEEEPQFGLFAFRLDVILSIMDYTSRKEKYINMAIKLNEMLNKFKKEKENKEVSVDNDAEFYFMSGQLIRYLASQSEKGNKKADLMGNFMVRNRDKIKDHIIDLYGLYSYKLPLFSTSYVNLVFQQVVSYGIAEIEEKNKDNWYYYQAGLTGKNIIFYKPEIEENKKEYDLENSTGNDDNLNIQKEGSNQ